MRNSICRSLFLAAALAATRIAAAATSPVLLTMDDLPGRVLNGFAHPKGVTFGFTVNGAASTDARYNSGGPGPITFVQDPSIEGTTGGVMSLTFAVPTSILEFGVARSWNSYLPNALAVELFNAADASLGVNSMTLTPSPMFAEGRFEYGGDLVKRATINFTTVGIDNGGPRFAFDNLLFNVPEPGALSLAAVAAVALGYLRRRL